MSGNVMRTSVLIWCVYFLSGLGYSRTFKVAALVPEGTTWANSLRKMAADIKKETNNRIRFKLYLGGVAGDEPDVQRKIKVGQLHGGVFTGKALGDIYGDVRLMEVPFSFNQDRKKALAVLSGMRNHFDQGLANKGYVNLGFFEVGNVYIVATKKAENLGHLKGMKIWAWEGDELGSSMLDSLQLVSVPLSLPDVLTSLSTGIVDAAYASPLAILALQWQSKIKYLVDVPVVYAVGAFLLDQKSWNKINPGDQKILKKYAEKNILRSNDQTFQENEESLKALKSTHQVEFVTFPKKDIEAGVGVRSKVLNQLTGRLFSSDGVKLFQEQLALAKKGIK